MAWEPWLQTVVVSGGVGDGPGTIEVDDRHASQCSWDFSCRNGSVPFDLRDESESSSLADFSGRGTGEIL